jgi:probable F420-dependent oxidoreductase
MGGLDSTAMNLGPTGVWSIGLRFHADVGLVADAAAELEELGYAALWIPGGVGGDLLGDVRRLLEAANAVAVGTGILNIWKHDVADVTRDAQRIDDDHPGRLILGLGRSHAALVTGEDGGARYHHPLAAMASFLDALDGMGPAVASDRRVLAALGPRSLEMARARAAGTHTYFMPVEHARYARRVLGPDRLVAPEQAVVLDPDPESARATARAYMASYLAMPNYTDNLLRLGYSETDLADGGSDRLVDAVVAWGDEAVIAERVAAQRDAGADHVAVQVLGGDEAGLPRDAWRRLAPALVT